MPKIFDCFTVYREKELLAIRFDYLWDSVDYFVVVECTKTHAGTDKPLFFKDNFHLFEKWKDKIIHVVLDDAPPLQFNWQIENFIRNGISRGIVKNAGPDDIILVSDADEIPNKKWMDFLRSPLYNGKPIAFSQTHHLYFFNIIARSNYWIGTVATKMWFLLDGFDPQYLRNTKDALPYLCDGGWHLSYFGGCNEIYEKFKTSCDVDDKNSVPKPEELRQRIIKRVGEDGQFNIRHLNSNTLPVFFTRDIKNIPVADIDQLHDGFDFGKLWINDLNEVRL